MKMTTRRKVRDHNAPTMGKSVRDMAKKGRFGDNTVGHLTPGEVVVPRGVWEADPALRQHASQAMMQAGLDPAQYVVGHPKNSRNPKTGAREFAAQMVSDPVNGTYWWDPSTGTASSAPPQESAPPQNNSASAMSAAAPQDNRNWGSSANQDVNRQLAQATGFSGDFGGWTGGSTGGFNQYMANATPEQRQRAEQILRDAGQSNRIMDWGAGAPQDDGSANNYGSPMAETSGDQSWGSNPDNYQVNQQLAQQLGYTGNFGGGAFNDWINTQPYATQQQAANILGAAGQPERIGNWGGNGFLNESPYVNGTVPVGYVAPPPPPESGPTQPLGQGFNTFDFGTGQDQVKNLKAYYDKYGQIPVASGFTPENNSSFGIYDPRPGFGGDWDPTFTQLAELTPEQFAALAESIGVDPNSRDAYLYLENYFGLETLDYGPVVYQNGVYQGLANQNNPIVRESPLDRGYITVGTWPNVVDVPLEDIYSGKVNINALELALSAGYDPNGLEGTMTSLQAADQIYRAMPDLKRIPINSAEFNTIRKPLEQAVPGFNAQVQNRINRQISQGRSIPSGNAVGPTDLGQVLSGVSTAPIGTTGGTPTANAMSAGTPGGSIMGGALDYSNNSPGWDRGSELLSQPGMFSIWRHPDGTIYHSDANGEWVLEPVGNGMYRDTLYGVLRNSVGTIVNPDGSPVITQYSAQNHPNGSADIGRLYGSSGANAMLGPFYGVDLTTLRDGNNTPIRGSYATGYTGVPPARTGAAQPDVRSGTAGVGGPAPSNGGVSTTPVNTGGTNGTTTTGTGLTPGTTNPYSLPINFFFGMPTAGGTGTGTTTPQQSTVDPLSWLSLLNLGYGSSTYGYPTYQSQNPQDAGGLNYVQPNSQLVEFRSPFTY